MTLALLAALVGTLGYGAASVLQAIGAARAIGLAELRQPTDSPATRSRGWPHYWRWASCRCSPFKACWPGREP